MSYGSNELYQKIDADPGVQALISTYGAGERMIFVDSVLPDKIVENDSVTINLYPVANFDNRLEYGDYRYSISCRGPNYSRAVELARAVVAAVNRRQGNDDTFFYSETLPVISPADGTDNYNVPVEVTIKTRS